MSAIHRPTNAGTISTALLTPSKSPKPTHNVNCSSVPFLSSQCRRPPHPAPAAAAATAFIIQQLHKSSLRCHLAKITASRYHLLLRTRYASSKRNERIHLCFRVIASLRMVVVYGTFDNHVEEANEAKIQAQAVTLCMRT